MKDEKKKREYSKPTVQSEQAPERQILQTTPTCSWAGRFQPGGACVKNNV